MVMIVDDATAQAKPANDFATTAAQVTRYRPRIAIGKRAFDIVGALSLLVLLSPVFLILGILVAMDGGSVFFGHKRVGRNGEVFACWKFRTMIVDAEACLDEYLFHHPAARDEWLGAQKLVFDPRITAIGRFLRRSSLDELPQLWNVVVGEMSLVGPRPVTAGELAHYGAVTPVFLSVRPGMTGLWQVSGRNEVGYEQRVALDVRYVETQSFLLDARLLVKTIDVVLSGRGAR